MGHKGDSHFLKNNTRLKNSITNCKNYKGDGYDKATILLISLVQNHCFLSANRRTAYYSSLRFLYLNGENISIHSKNSYQTINSNFMIGVREGNYYTFEEIKNFLKEAKIRDYEREL